MMAFVSLIGHQSKKIAFDLGLTSVVDGDLGTVFSWYDNEAGYTATLAQIPALRERLRQP